MIHENTLRAIVEERAAGRVTKRALEILRIYAARDYAMTDRQVLKAGEWGDDPNCVRPRITELVTAGILEEVDNVISQETGKRVRRVRIRIAAPEAAAQGSLF